MLRRGGAGGAGQPEQANDASRRGQRQEDRHEFGRGGSAERYKMREKMVAIGDDFWIENEQGRRAFKVDGKLLRVRDILVFEDANGRELVKMASKIVQIKDQIKLERTGGPSAVVKKDLINVVRDHFIMRVDNGTEYDIRGNLLDHEYEITQGRNKVAEISKKWFRIADTYGVQIEQGADDVLILAATVAVDQLSHDAA
ncbi:MAG: LURP-one-related family protein [Caldilineaceae bacterium]